MSVNGLGYCVNKCTRVPNDNARANSSKSAYVLAVEYDEDGIIRLDNDQMSVNVLGYCVNKCTRVPNDNAMY